MHQTTPRPASISQYSKSPRPHHELQALVFNVRGIFRPQQWPSPRTPRSTTSRARRTATVSRSPRRRDTLPSRELTPSSAATIVTPCTAP